MDTGEPLAPHRGSSDDVGQRLSRRSRPVVGGPRPRRPDRALRPDHGHRPGSRRPDARVAWGTWPTGTGSPPAPLPATSSSAAPSATGGNFSRLWEVPDLWNVGYPIAECAEDGTFVVTKHPAPADGRRSIRSPSTRLRDGRSRPLHHPGRGGRLHHHPARPEGVPTGATSPASRAARIRRSSRSPPPTSTGYKAGGQVTLSGPRAVEKAQLAADVVWKRLERAGVSFAARRPFEIGAGGRRRLPARRAAGLA
jgi:hypothetical protein